jgi:hypothetical protein
MVVESFMVTALPYSADPAATFHVSLFITHRLTPDDPAGGVLGDFPNVAAWGARLADADVTLTTAAGHTIPTTVVTQVAPALWPTVFPSTLAVRGFPTPELTAAPWRTFPAAKMDGYARAVHTVAAVLSPVEPPSIVDALLPLLAGGGQLAPGVTEQVVAGLRDQRLDRRWWKDRYEELLEAQVGRVASNDPRGTSALRHLELLDERFTAELDEVTAQGTRAVTVDHPLHQLLLDLHRARRFYERPEEQRAYHERPDPDAEVPTPITPPDPDFHQRCTLLTDTPGVLRELGLVIDLHIDDLSSLQGIDAIRGDVTIDGLDNPVHVQPLVTCHRMGTTFTTMSGTGDHVHGALRLGDEDRFQVLDLDPDAGALKLERFVRSLPRVVWSALNGDAATGAPASLRASGFAIAQIEGPSRLHDRVADAAHRDDELLTGHVAPLTTEDVARGLRLEVWDDHTATWRSLHERRVDIEVDGDPVVTDEPDIGFLQGAALTRADATVNDDPTRPYHAHEVVAGWEGWSLSVPPVGKVVTDETQEPGDQPGDAPGDLHVTPVVVRPRSAEGTLPRLRYGRNYAFRAWAVDLAGNSPPHSVAGVADEPPGPGDGDTTSRRAGAGRSSRGVPEMLAAAGRPGRVAPGFDALEASLHDGVLAALPFREAVPERPVPLDEVAPTGVEAIDAILRARLASHSLATGGPTGERVALSRRSRIEATMAEVARVEPRLAVPTSTNVGREALLAAIASAAATSFGPGAAGDPAVLDTVASLVTAPRPFLRWDAVASPAVVPRFRYSEGESLLTLVVRSGVEVTEDGVIELVDPATYAAAVVTDHPDLVWREDSQRHVAPPKTSQQEVERHGKLDAAFGPGATAARRRRALATSLREAGSFLDRTIAHRTQPGQRVDQPDVSLHNQPTADPDALVDLDTIDAARGTPLAAGQYVVHGAATIALPYLADPLADGASLVFPDAGRDHRLQVPFAIEGVRLPYLGDWPDQRPHRLVLEAGDELSARVDGHVVTVAVPPGEHLRVRLSTSLHREDLELLGLWQGLPAAFRQHPEIADAARDGWLWWLTPAEELRLVHAVPRPVERPRVPAVVPLRAEGATDVTLLGIVDVHGPSTERLDIEATWTERIDDPAKETWEEIARTGAAGDTEVAYHEDLVLLGPAALAGTTIPLGDGASLTAHTATHVFEDTKHRLVDYTIRATSRYREFFAPAVTPTVDDLSVVSDPVRVSVPSSARPPKPVVRDVLPLFRWEERTEPEQPFGLRRARRSGLRLYLERPWYTSGDGELLGVVLSAGAASTREVVSQWAADPIWQQAGPSSTTTLPLLDLHHLLAQDGTVAPGRPVGPAATLPLPDLPNAPQVRVLGYEPDFSSDRGLWSVDIALDPGTAFWPFVRLAVVRYQPASRAGLHLSPVVVCDFAQLTPERLATLTRPDEDTVRVIVTGAVGERQGTLAPDPSGRREHDRMVVARLERRDPELDSDLAWITRAVQVLPVRGRDGQVVSWNGTLPLPEPIPPRRPGADPDWRVTVEEWEVLPADGDDPSEVTRESRLVYADHLPL